MKHGLLVYDEFPEFGGQNIGDYIQSLAAEQFWKNSEVVYCKRDWLNTYKGEKIKIIMNGWFSHIPENFPPAQDIYPLFVAFHLNSSVKDRFLSSETINYLKKYEPIGCRDKYTVKILEEKGVKAYFTGCLTLTLGKKYKCAEKSENVYIIDPYIGIDKSFISIVRIFFTLITKFKFIRRLQREMFCEKSLKSAVKAALFINQYSKLWGYKFLLKANYIHHMFSCKTVEDYFSSAESLIKKYATAKLVITSRIHVALPCTGLETPVLFINDLNDSELSTCRFEGLLELFNIINHDGKCLINDNNVDLFSPKLNLRYSDLAFELIKKCEEFCNE